MLNQIKYSARNGLNQRLYALCFFVGVNVVCGILGGFNIYGNGWKTTAVVFSSIGLGALVIASIIADVQSVKSLYDAPDAYTTNLAPVKGWKILLGRIIPMLVFDIVSVLIGVAGILLQTSILSGWDIIFKSDYLSYGEIFSQIFWLALIIILAYLLIALLVFFFGALTKSVFYRLRFRWFFAAVATIAVFYVMSWFDLSLALVCPLERTRWFFSVWVTMGLNSGMIGYLLLGVVKCVLVFVPTAYLIERKLNV